MNKKLALIALVPFALQAKFETPKAFLPTDLAAFVTKDAKGTHVLANGIVLGAEAYTKERLRKKLHEIADKIDAKALNEKDLKVFTTKDLARFSADVAAECITAALKELKEEGATLLSSSLRTLFTLHKTIITRALVTASKKAGNALNTKVLKEYLGLDADVKNFFVDAKDGEEESTHLDHAFNGAVDLLLNEIIGHWVNNTTWKKAESN